ncbi:MAG: PQQ-dependent sugar dehydrogenase [Pseudomonadales bacterium]|nr:PQQ-dependent sugar dehydrogenase [Pseudomonadales bacterium]
MKHIQGFGKLLVLFFLVILIGFIGSWLFLPSVNYPLLGSLANLFPGSFMAPRAESEWVNERLKVAEGYSVSLFAGDVAGVRVLLNTSPGDLLVSSASLNQVLWLERDLNGDGRSAARKVLLDNLKEPHGLGFHGGYLYVAEEGQIGRIRFNEQSADISGAYEILIADLPTGGNHWRKTLHFGPDGLMYVAVGSSCNVCLEEDERRATMLRYTPEGEFLGIYASGLRNSAGFDWSPGNGKLFATDNGRDLLGDDYPPCELNEIVEGGFYGWPFANGNAEPDPDFGKTENAVITSSLSPVFGFNPHNAPLGFLFLRGASHPLTQVADHVDTALVALHGSWNRSVKDGYKVVSLQWDGKGNIHASDFLTGFLIDGKVIGRPAELSEAADQSIYISDDYANAVYRVVALTPKSIRLDR